MKTIKYIVHQPSIEKVHPSYHKHKTTKHSEPNIIEQLKISDSELLHTSNKYGLLVSIILILFFLLMKYFNMHYQILLRYVNFIFLFAGVFSSLHFYKQKYHNKINYHTGLKVGMRVSLMAITPFALFICLYLVANPNFITFINAQIDIEKSNFITPIIALIFLWAEGISIGILYTLIILKYLKKRN